MANESKQEKEVKQKTTESKQTKPTVSCINLGYYQVKANNGICFKSMAKTTIDENQIAKGDVLKLGEDKYILEIGHPMLESDKTISPLTKIFVLNALAKQMESEISKEFNVLMTAPPISFRKQKEDLPKYLEGEYEIEYNGEKKLINIKKVIVLPETFLVYLTNNPNKLMGKKTFILDIGGRTTNICMLTDCKFDSEADFGYISKGMYHINSEIANRINAEKYKSYDYDDIEIMRNTNSKTLIENESIVNEVYSNHVEDIVNQIQIKSWEVDENANILICGGGGIILSDSIKKVYPNATLSHDPLYDNLLALELVSKEIFK